MIQTAWGSRFWNHLAYLLNFPFFSCTSTVNCTEKTSIHDGTQNVVVSFDYIKTVIFEKKKTLNFQYLPLLFISSISTRDSFFVEEAGLFT